MGGMLYELGHLLEPLFGPFRLLQSHGLLIVTGIYLGFSLTFILLPRFFHRLPQDRGKTVSVQGEAAKGKPTGAGIVFMLIFMAVEFLVCPWDWVITGICLTGLGVMLTGYLDDRARGEWSEYLKGALDLVLALGASAILAWGRPLQLWLPFVSGSLEIPAWLFMAISTVVIWTSINATNCSDGVDGLSGTLVLLALLSMGSLMYFVLGNTTISNYLLVPHLADGARWAIMTFVLAGCLTAYLWYNAYPSRVLMGDAGSRPLGYMIGVLVMASGNPFLILVIATVLLVNGGTGLIKVALLRFLKIRILHNTRFPLHDHVRQNNQWSNTQVLVKFAITQLLITLGMFVIFFKIR